MVRVAAKLFVLAVLLLATPAVTAAITVKDSFPVKGAWPLTPQLHCEIVFDARSSERCQVWGSGAGVNEIRARIVGQARVRAYLTDEGVAIPITLGVLDCTRSCAIPLPNAYNSHRFDLLILADGGPNAVVSVTIGTGTGGTIA